MNEQSGSSGTAEQNPEVSGKVAEAETEAEESNMELSRLRRELEKANAAKAELEKENKKQAKELRSFRTAEENQAEEKRLADEEKDRKIADYERRLTVAETSKRLISLLGDEKNATAVAQSLYGAEDVDAAIDVIEKVWKQKERELETRFSVIKAPGIGVGSEDGVSITKDELMKMTYRTRAAFAKEHPEAYARAMSEKK